MKKLGIVILLCILIVGMNSAFIGAEETATGTGQSEISATVEDSEQNQNEGDSEDNQENNADAENNDDEEEIDLPEYELMGKFKSDTGLISADILIEEYTQDEPAEEVQRQVYKKIAEIEELDIAYFYRTEAAYKANISSSYTAKTESALKQGFLGMLDQDGTYYDNEVFGY